MHATEHAEEATKAFGKEHGEKYMVKSANSLISSHHSIASFDTGDAIELHGETSHRTRISISAQIDPLELSAPTHPSIFMRANPCVSKGATLIKI